jgi:hypothetical protein
MLILQTTLSDEERCVQDAGGLGFGKEFDTSHGRQ